MENFKQYLSEGADDRERETARQVLDGLTGLRLEQKVAEVAVERQALLRRKFWARVIWGATLAVIAGVAFWYLQKPAPGLEEKLIEQPGLQQPIANDTPAHTPPQIPKQTQEKSNPIAQNNSSKRLPSPRFPSPNIRGQNSEDKAWEAMLDQVWYTEYPIIELGLSEQFGKADQSLRSRDFSSAYIQLQRLEKKLPENDTLQLLKAYCLMEMGEGAEALTYFEKLNGKQAAWEMDLEWYKSLSLLLTGDQEKALSAFRKIANNARHPYREQGKKALQVLK